MRSDDYHRLHVACLAIAQQSTEPDLQARWLAAADAWLKLATEQHERSRSVAAVATRHCCPDVPIGVMQTRNARFMTNFSGSLSPDWIKVKNPNAPAATRLIEDEHRTPH
jgi:hypothetical protein